jgi:drug/metabolite transporter (DMT)-like permease
VGQARPETHGRVNRAMEVLLLLLTLVFTWMHHRARPRSSYTSIRLTTIAQTGIASLLASNSSLVAMLFGFLALHQRPDRYQLLGLALVLLGWFHPTKRPDAAVEARAVQRQ